MPQKPKDNEQCSLCGRWDNRPIGVDTVVVKDGRVLMLKRSTNPDAGMYALPGGYLDRGESAEQAALREVKEETGIEARITKPLTPVTYWYQFEGEKIALINYFQTNYQMLHRHHHH